MATSEENVPHSGTREGGTGREDKGIHFGRFRGGTCPLEKVELPDEIKELFKRAGIKPHEVLRVRLPEGKTVTYLEENAGHRCIKKYSS